MTELEVATLSTAVAGIVRDVVRDATAVLEQRLAIVEGNGRQELDALRTFMREVGELRERLAVVEVREPVPGPPGPAGSPGLDGKDGAPGLRYCGVYVESKTYDRGDVATWGGSAWHCNADETTGKPGDDSKAWSLMVKAGRDVGRDTRERGK